MRRATSRTVLASESPLRASARCCGVPLGQRRVADLPCGSSCFTTRDASDRLLPSHVFVRAPAPRRFPVASTAFAPAQSEISPVSRQCDSLRWAARSPWMVTAAGLLFPPRCVRAGPLTSLSPLPRVSPRSRGVRTWESRRDRLQLTRVNGASRADDPGCLPSCKDPSPRDALSSARLRTSPGSRFGHRMPGSRRLFTPDCPCEHPGAGLPSTCPVANGSHASSSLGAACRLLQPDTSRGHTLRAVDPRTRVELSPRYSPAPTDASCVGLRDALPHRGPASRDLYAPTCVRCVPLAWTRQVTGRSVRAKASRALLDDVARALLVAPRAPGSPARFVAGVGGPP
jgi:hypothetical protein